MHPHEESLIKSFFAPNRRVRYLALLGDPDKRHKALNRLNHLRDLDPRYATELRPRVDVYALLKSKGAPDTCYVVSDNFELDAREMDLREALADGRGGTLIGCIPGHLAYYHGECGESRTLLER